MTRFELVDLLFIYSNPGKATVLDTLGSLLIEAMYLIDEVPQRTACLFPSFFPLQKKASGLQCSSLGVCIESQSR